MSEQPLPKEVLDGLREREGAKMALTREQQALLTGYLAGAGLDRDGWEIDLAQGIIKRTEKPVAAD